MTVWARGLLIWGLVGAALSGLPTLLLLLLPALAEGFLRSVAVLLVLGVLPLCLLTAALGLLLGLWAWITGAARR